MWYFLVKQSTLETVQYQALQKLALQTEVELFNEPYENWYVFTVEKEMYATFMDSLDVQGISYELTADRPTHSDMLARMQ